VGVPEEVGVDVAKGIRTPESVRDTYLKPKLVEVDQELVWKEKYEEEHRIRKEFEKRLGEYSEQVKLLQAENKKLETELANVKFLSQKDSEQVQQLLAEKNELLERIEKLEKDLSQYKAEHEIIENLRRLLIPSAPLGFEPSYSVPSEVSVSVEQPSLTVKVERRAIELTDKTTEGKIAIIYAEGKLPVDKWFTTTDVVNAFVSHGWTRDPRIGPTLDKLCQWGFLEKHYAGKRPEYRVKLTPKEAEEKGLLKKVED
jgi:hypothetical protein